MHKVLAKTHKVAWAYDVGLVLDTAIMEEDEQQGTSNIMPDNTSNR